jgi:hypothetical protein
MGDCFGSYRKKNCTITKNEVRINEIDDTINDLIRSLSHGSRLFLQGKNSTIISVKIAALQNEREKLKICSTRWICSSWSHNPLNTKSFMFRFYAIMFTVQFALVPIFGYNHLSSLNLWSFSGVISFGLIWVVILFFGYRQKKDINKRLLTAIAEEL